MSGLGEIRNKLARHVAGCVRDEYSVRFHLARLEKSEGRVNINGNSGGTGDSLLKRLTRTRLV
jgi:hypothetical protein